MGKSVVLKPELIRFLTKLKRNNDREWFQANKESYLADVRDPLLAFIEAFAAPLKRISPHFVADSRPVGGSLFRIYRDTRFSRDKSPYKTYIGVQFRHAAAKDVHAPGFYFHIQPGELFVAAGLWHPDSDTLRKIRGGIVENPAGWKRVSRAKAFLDRFEMAGDVLKRPPKGYDAAHPLVEDLKRKDFIAVEKLTEKELCAPDFSKRLGQSFTAAKPFVKYLTEAVGLPF